MIRNSELLRDLDLHHERRVLETLSFRDALSRFEALWHEARALNGLPPAP